MVDLAHLQYTVGKGYSDSHWQTFWDSHDEHDEGNDNVVNQFLGKDFSSYGIINSSLDKQYGEGRSKDNNSSNESDELQATADVVKAVGELSLLLTSIKLIVVYTTGGIFSDAGNEGFAGAVDNVGVGKEEGILFFVLV